MYEVMISLSQKYGDKQLCLEEKFEDTKGVIRNRKRRRRTDNTMATRYQRSNQKPSKEKKDRQYNGHKIPKE